MAVINIPIPESGLSTEQLANLLAQVIKEVQWLVNGNLDVNNVRANTITADRMNVQKLSAIAADLGKVVAGILIGAYISTADNTYPRIDFSSSGNLLAAFQNATTYIRIIPSSSGTTPILEATDGTSTLLLGILGGTTTFNAKTGNQSIQSQAGDLSLSANNILKLNGASLQMNSTPGVSGTVYVSTTSGGPATTAMTFTNGIRTA